MEINCKMKELDAFLVVFFLNETENLDSKLAALSDGQNSKDILNLIHTYSKDYQNLIDLYRNITGHISKKADQQIEKIFSFQKEILQEYLIFYMSAPNQAMRKAFHHTQPNVHHNINIKMLEFCFKTVEKFRHNLIQSADLLLSYPRHKNFETLCLSQKKLDTKMMSEKIRMRSMQKLSDIPESSKLNFNPHVFKEIQQLKQELANSKLELIRTLDLTEIQNCLNKAA